MDDIQKLLHHAGRILAKVFTGKEIKNEFASQLELLESEDILAIAEGLIEEKRYSDCEDFMFFSIERNYSTELYNMGEHLAERVEATDEEKLQTSSYSQADASRWLADWRQYKP